MTGQPVRDSDDDPRADLRWPTIPAVLTDAAGRLGDREAIVDQDGAGGFRTIWAPNGAEWVVALVGLQSVGAVLVPLNTRYKGAEAADIVERSRARILVTVDGFLGNHYPAMLAGHALPHLERIVVLRAGDGSGDSDAEPGATVPTETCAGPPAASAGPGVPLKVTSGAFLNATTISVPRFHSPLPERR